MKLTLAAIAALALAGCAAAPSPAPATTTADANTRTIKVSALIAAPPADVYRAVATVEGWKTWAVPAAFGEVKPGGILETSYNKDARPGDPGNIKQEFLVVEPQRRVVFRTVKTPDGFPHADLYMKTVATFELKPEGAGTRLTFTHEGFGQEPGFDELYEFFLKGDAETLEELQKALAP